MTRFAIYFPEKKLYGRFESYASVKFVESEQADLYTRKADALKRSTMNLWNKHTVYRGPIEVHEIKITHEIITKVRIR